MKHLQNIRQIFEKLRTVCMKLKQSKCFFARHEVDVLGSIITEEGISSLTRKINKV
ncbi:hypothetical protein PHYBLDRAFT_27132 [Phycomyces blakesleeanus NRRL 1555(-)]|uniref:Uncharacterized protein n=1 Tax=Phycomyces blakesleeanus (strain ATCC 8743b / DSM 1359 / FGSC 10004 / NBRC 33097 / NRRL 1555) TaxID=763407 RepID=A0A162T8J4_PHYB8|nr:hypothetical protein PHYBLDRAFT_27132 [Phycomyces blakesleeanus NRRL 1555(-)]OAD66902.1 hypothetical protein PHYBLDRAFT_27132 [Phycomyces blakesleeanus NRRL 1555(-)]|eukprot:XP_018284942.1 hypothetical protein PHYBLDRAFT_27132 [Phycomyces blakesleeanus NRRL 1555(-)]